MIIQHVVQLSFPHDGGFVQQHRSRFGGHPSEAMAPSLPGAFLDARFVPAAWSAGTNGELVPNTQPCCQPRDVEPSGFFWNLLVTPLSEQLLPPSPASSVCSENREDQPPQQGSRGAGVVEVRSRNTRSPPRASTASLCAGGSAIHGGVNQHWCGCDALFFHSPMEKGKFSKHFAGCP